MKKEALRFPLFQISKKCMNDKLRGEAEVKLRKVNEEILRIEEEVENANRAIVLKLLDCIGSAYQDLRGNAKDINEHSAQEIAEACAEIEEYAKELRLLLKTYIVE